MYDDLLVHVISSRGKVNLEQFNEIFRGISFSDKEEDDSDYYNNKNQTIRFLDSLGFCEFDFDRRIVYACPPYLVSLPTCGLPSALLVGARTPDLVKKLKDAVSKKRGNVLLSIQKQQSKKIYIPPLIKLEAINNALLKEIADECDIKYELRDQAAFCLLNFSADLSAIESSLDFKKSQEPNNWQKRIFSLEKAQFLKLGNAPINAKGLVEYTNPTTKQRRYWFWRDNQAAEIDLDWGRYFALKQGDINVVFYDYKLRKFAVPVTVPIPTIISRALVMCSGLAPIIEKARFEMNESVPVGNKMYIYTNVPQDFAKMCGDKLGQKITAFKIENTIGGALQ